VRAAPGEPQTPAIELPPGCRFCEPAQTYSFASPGEYCTFFQGQTRAARIRIRWPGVPVLAVVHRHERLPLTRHGELVETDVPLSSATLRDAWDTLEVWSHLDEKHLPLRIEHNHPDRRAGYYYQNPWVGEQARACINYLIASREILHDWGLHHAIADAGLGTISLMGFESNNPLHGDAPPHWHWIYYWPTEAGSQVPHLYIGPQGRTLSNNVWVFAREDLKRTAGPDDPMIFRDPSGKEWFAIDIRRDGGVNIEPSFGCRPYAIVAGPDGRFDNSVIVRRDGRDWLEVSAGDDTATGRLSLHLRDVSSGSATSQTHLYDPLTGTPRPPGPQEAV
jgi:hypothetical protein